MQTRKPPRRRCIVCLCDLEPGQKTACPACKRLKEQIGEAHAGGRRQSEAARREARLRKPVHLPAGVRFT